MTEVARKYVQPGELITKHQGFLRGHGTLVVDGNLIAIVSGFVEQTNKLISVIPLNSRYTGDVGDVVVGRITEVGDKRWKVDVQGRQNAVLQLSSIHLPGGVQRRRNMEDALQMRKFFVEGDLVSAEVQKVYRDDSFALHTRSTKYGKLVGGTLLVVSQSLVKRAKHHFVSLECGVDVILGNNGFIWVTHTKSEEEKKTLDEMYEKEGSGFMHAAETLPEISREVRERICRVRNAIEVLSRLHVHISAKSIMSVYRHSVNLGLSASEMLHDENTEELCGVVDDDDEDEDVAME